MRRLTGLTAIRPLLRRKVPECRLRRRFGVPKLNCVADELRRVEMSKVRQIGMAVASSSVVVALVVVVGAGVKFH